MIEEVLVQPKDIESQLTKIWDTLQGKNKMRACLFNLIIYSKRDARRQYLESVAKRVVKKFPCRILFITTDQKSQENSMKSFVSAMAVEEGDSGIFCDLIQIELSGKDCEKAPFLILPHILPDLPIYLVWGQDPSEESSLLFQLETHASKSIFDSETAKSLTEFAKNVLLHHDKTRSAIIDLNWARIESWRNLIASYFYCKEKVEFIQNAKKITLTYNDRKTEQLSQVLIQSIYLTCWIASSANLKFGQKTEKGFIFKHQGKEIVFELIPKTEGKIKPGRILSIDIENDAKEAYHFVRKEAYPYIVNIHHSLPTFCETPSQYLLDKEESGESLTTEIFHTGTSVHFLNTLKLVIEALSS